MSGRKQQIADSLIGRASEGSPRAFYGVQAAIQPLHTFVNCPKLAHANALQLQKFTLIARQHEGLDSLPLPDKQTEGLAVKPKTYLKKEHTSQSSVLTLIAARRIVFFPFVTKYGSASMRKVSILTLFFSPPHRRFLREIPEVGLAACNFAQNKKCGGSGG